MHYLISYSVINICNCILRAGNLSVLAEQVYKMEKELMCGLADVCLLRPKQCMFSESGLDLQMIVCLIQLSLDNSLLTALSAGKLLLDDGGRRLTVSAA